MLGRSRLFLRGKAPSNSTAPGDVLASTQSYEHAELHRFLEQPAFGVAGHLTRQAGFFAHGEDRLVRPSFPDTPSTLPIDPPKEGGKVKDKNGGGGGGDDLPPLDGLILALVKKLPPTGTKEWQVQDRIMWLQMAAMAFQMAYGSVEPIEIKPRNGNS